MSRFPNGATVPRPEALESWERYCRAVERNGGRPPRDPRTGRVLAWTCTDVESGDGIWFNPDERRGLVRDAAARQDRVARELLTELRESRWRRRPSERELGHTVNRLF